MTGFFNSYDSQLIKETMIKNDIGVDCHIICDENNNDNDRNRLILYKKGERIDVSIVKIYTIILRLF